MVLELTLLIPAKLRVQIKRSPVAIVTGKHLGYRDWEAGIRLQDYRVSDLRFSVSDLEKIQRSIDECLVGGDASAAYDAAGIS